MYFYDHQPPHFHAQYAAHHAVIAIDGQTVLVGGREHDRSCPAVLRRLEATGRGRVLALHADLILSDVYVP
jgi:hypothetical protein